MTLTLIVLLLAAVAFAWGRWRSDIVALCAVIVLLLGGVLTPAEALAGFSNPIIIMMAGLFIVGGGVFQTGLAKMVVGRKADDVKELLRGIPCRGATSCPDQLARAIDAYEQQEAK